MPITLTNEDLTRVFSRATEAGSAAAMTEMHDRIRSAKPHTKMLDHCGGAMLRTMVDGRSSVGKLLAAYSDPRFSITTAHRGGYNLALPYRFEAVEPANMQDAYLWSSAAKAAAKVIEAELGISCFVEEYLS